MSPLHFLCQQLMLYLYCLLLHLVALTVAWSIGTAFAIQLALQEEEQAEKEEKKRKEGSIGLLGVWGRVGNQKRLAPTTY
jgi:hypothetical protein